MLCYIASETRASPSLMGVSWREYVQEKQRRWTVVDRFKANSPDAGAPNSEEQERKQIQHAFFSKKRTGFPTKAQLKQMRRLL